MWEREHFFCVCNVSRSVVLCLCVYVWDRESLCSVSTSFERCGSCDRVPHRVPCANMCFAWLCRHACQLAMYAWHITFKFCLWYVRACSFTCVLSREIRGKCFVRIMHRANFTSAGSNGCAHYIYTSIYTNINVHYNKICSQIYDTSTTHATTTDGGQGRLPPGVPHRGPIRPCCWFLQRHIGYHHQHEPAIHTNSCQEQCQHAWMGRARCDNGHDALHIPVWNHPLDTCTYSCFLFIIVFCLCTLPAHVPMCLRAHVPMCPCAHVPMCPRVHVRTCVPTFPRVSCGRGRWSCNISSVVFMPELIRTHDDNFTWW